MATVREFEPTVVRAFSRSGYDLGLVRLPWSNIAPGDVLASERNVMRVVDVVAMPAGSGVAALAKVDRINWSAPE